MSPVSPVFHNEFKKEITDPTKGHWQLGNKKESQKSKCGSQKFLYHAEKK